MADPGDHDTQGAPDVDQQVMGLLHDHVPLTLLVDLADAPASEQVLREEGMPDVPWWEGSTNRAGPERDAPPSL